jgi:hypothetical protein
MTLQPQLVSVGVVALFTVAIPPASAQQVPFSQRATVTQRVSYTDIDITYSRPTARGRKLFGSDAAAVVKFGRPWNAGADSASRIRFSKNVVFEGRPVRRGEYSLWLVPNANGPWTVILNSAARVLHLPYPGERTDALRVMVTPERGSHMDALAYYFPVVARDSTVLRIHWGEVMIPIRIRVSRQP